MGIASIPGGSPSDFVEFLAGKLIRRKVAKLGEIDLKVLIIRAVKARDEVTLLKLIHEEQSSLSWAQPCFAF